MSLTKDRVLYQPGMTLYSELGGRVVPIETGKEVIPGYASTEDYDVRIINISSHYGLRSWAAEAALRWKSHSELVRQGHAAHDDELSDRDEDPVGRLEAV